MVYHHTHHDRGIIPPSNSNRFENRNLFEVEIEGKTKWNKNTQKNRLRVKKKYDRDFWDKNELVGKGRDHHEMILKENMSVEWVAIRQAAKARLPPAGEVKLVGT